MTGPQKKLKDEQHVTAAEQVQTSRQNTASVNWLATLSGKDKSLNSLENFQRHVFPTDKVFSLTITLPLLYVDIIKIEKKIFQNTARSSLFYCEIYLSIFSPLL